MRNRPVALLVMIVAVAVATSTGCVTKKLFRENIEDTNTRLNSTESAIESNEQRIGDLRTETDSKIAELENETERAVEVGTSAMSRANEAAQQAELARKGRLIWEVTLTDQNVKFNFNDEALPDSARSTLDDLASRIKALGKAVFVEIEGHTDSTGPEDYNVSLGEQRAEAVRNYLGVNGGIPLHAMNTISFGESRPVADNGTSEGRSANRRVVVRVLE